MTKRFVQAVLKSEVGLRPVIPLAQPIGLGYVGEVDADGVWTHVGTLQTLLGLNDLGGELPPQDKSLNMSVTSGKSVKVAFGASASTDGVLAEFGNLKAKASISFGAENGFFLALDGLRVNQLAEPQKLHPAILTSYVLKQWQEDWVFIHQIGIAKKLTAIIASESDTTVLLKGSGQVAAKAAAEVDLSGSFKFVASTKAVTQITGGKNVAAFYGAYRVRKSLLKGASVEPFKLIAQPFGRDLADFPEAARLQIPEEKMFSRV